MINLIKLEMRKTKIRTYINSSIIITVCMLGLLYTFAAISFAGIEADAAEFSSYYNIMVLTNAITMCAYSVLAAVMYSSFIIKEFADKNAILMFSYPVSRKSILLAKITLVAIFTLVSTIISTCIICLILGTTESIFPLVPDSISIYLVVKIIRDTICVGIIAVAIGIVSAYIGLIKKSSPVTIVSAVIICSCAANVIVAGMHLFFLIIGFTIGAAIAAVVALSGLMRKVDGMEV